MKNKDCPKCLGHGVIYEGRPLSYSATRTPCPKCKRVTVEEAANPDWSIPFKSDDNESGSMYT